MSLDVYLHGQPIGGLFPISDESFHFAYRPEVVEARGSGAMLLSSSLPVRSQPYGPHATRAYLEGLLPQGRLRRTIARELGLDPGDGYGLIAELGGDCLGAVTFLPAGEPLEDEDPQQPRWLGEEELDEVLRTPPRRLFDPDDPRRMRFALPGERHKLALVRNADGDRWAWPAPGLPSTHIVKPEPADRPGLVANEHACSLAYRDLGLPVAHTAIEEIAGHTCLVSKRFDRWGDGPGAQRLHQESFAQALGVAPDDGEGRLTIGTPTLGEASGLLRTIGEEGAVGALMGATFCDLLIGCTELRGANAGLLFGADGPMLAPFYDISSTEIYGETRPQPIAIGEDVPDAPLLIDLRHTIEHCDVDPQPAIIAAVSLMGPLCTALGALAERAQEEGWYRRSIDETIEIATARSLTFATDELIHLRPPGGEIPPWMG
jgi:serine/threonine-protein kinase HipA